MNRKRVMVAAAQIASASLLSDITD
jgi:hypothetical protein